jgi:hypothetical protein
LDNNDDEDDDDDEEEDDQDVELDRRARFRKAYQVALATDTQGYQVMATGAKETDRTPQELNAISWAGFCTDYITGESKEELQDLTFKIQALDCDNLLDRLKLASHMLRVKKTQLRVKMDKAGLSFGSDEFDDKEDEN